MPVIARGVQNLQRLTKQLDAAARGKLEAEAGKRVGAALLKVVSDEFRNSRGPYGVEWKPVFRRRRRDRNARIRRYLRQSKLGLPLEAKTDKPLIDTGRLRASTGVSVSGGQVRVFLTANYASYHQEGTRHIARRQILPDAEGLGPTWREAIEKAAKGAVRDHFKGG